MKKKMLLLVFALVLLFNITGCDSTKEPQNNNQQQGQRQEESEGNNQQSNSNTNTYVEDDEIIEWDDKDNDPYTEGNIIVEKVINCDKCVYAYFSDDKTFGSTLSDEEYTTDINNLKTMGGKQRYNFFGLVLSDNKIARAYSCILKDNKIYCLEGSVNGVYHTNNIGILNQIFTADQCKYISDGHTYVCTDGHYNGDTKTSGYTSLHYETSCTIYGANAKTGKMSCN